MTTVTASVTPAARPAAWRVQLSVFGLRTGVDELKKIVSLVSSIATHRQKSPGLSKLLLGLADLVSASIDL